MPSDETVDADFHLSDGDKEHNGYSFLDCPLCAFLNGKETV